MYRSRMLSRILKYHLSLLLHFQRKKNTNILNLLYTFLIGQLQNEKNACDEVCMALKFNSSWNKIRNENLFFIMYTHSQIEIKI